MIFWSGFVLASLCKELIHGKPQNQKALAEIGHEILGEGTQTNVDFFSSQKRLPIKRGSGIDVLFAHLRLGIMSACNTFCLRR